MEAVKIVLLTLIKAELTVEQSTLNHQSQMKYCWLKSVPLGQRKVYLRRPPIPSLAQMWNV